ncbi:MFS transporter [Chitinasiproducens palmae]|uniref:MFS transporter, MHS family, proline/betaine transporter n=1 Tax=Chitinasiproducens palmae TaxID=1770053 RepID=A0A1H2PJH4_9BURK|nr:MFS transporter [Chitinasiproducens palmae]SDV46480.1 MFS transporter, MHS family, proline/betaine transporter [Chitinasiproducens palmae]
MSIPAPHRRAIVAATIGNAFEWYDFIVFGFLSVIIARQFFPTTDPTTSALLTTASFGSAFLMRPIGGILIGLYADRVGRKAALSLVILLMTIASAIMAFTPSYRSIGIAAPVLIVLARLLQGLSAGGEFGSATSMLIEHAPSARRGFYGSWQNFGQFCAAVVAAAMGALVTRSLSPEALDAWGWRIPFVFGLLIGPVGLYIRTRVPEVPAAVAKPAIAAAGGTGTASVLRDVFSRYRGALLIAFGLTVFSSVAQYVLNVYLPIYAVQQLKLRIDAPFIVLMFTGTARMALIPLFGLLSDRVGRKPVMGAAMTGYVLTLYPLFSWLIAEPSLLRLLAVETVFAVLMAAAFGPASTALAELFPSRTRATGLSISYNLANTLFGGVSPFLVAWLVAITGNKMMPSHFVTVAALVGLLALWAMRESAPAVGGRDADDVPEAPAPPHRTPSS